MKKTILIAAVMFLAFSVAAFAQATFQVASTPVTQVASCGVTELTGDIAFTTVVGFSNITTGAITINYGVPITTVAGAQFVVSDSTGVLATTAIPVGNVSGNTLRIDVTPLGGTPPFTIRVTGVRVNVAGNPGLASLSATVSSTGNLFVGGQTSVLVISAIGSAIASADTGPAIAPTALTISSVSPATSLAADNSVNVRVIEGFANAWVQNAMVQVTASAIPAGITLTFPGSVTLPVPITPAGTTSTIFQRADATGAVLGTDVTLTSASTSLTVFYKVTTLSDVAVIATETLTIPVTVGLTVPAPTLPLAQSSVSVTVDMAPRDAPLSTLIPRYSGTTCQKGPFTILTIVTANTTLLIPFAVVDANFDTGIAIANTTADPLAAGQSAVDQNGTITFTFFPQTGTSFGPYTTSATSPGAGLTSGVLNAGGTYAVLLSQLLAAAGGPANFTGYVFAVVNATNAHGQYFVSDFEAFTNGALMLVVNPAQRNAPTPESLGN
jgi:hypothetical protein